MLKTNTVLPFMSQPITKWHTPKSVQSGATRSPIIFSSIEYTLIQLILELLSSIASIIPEAWEWAYMNWEVACLNTTLVGQ